MAIHIDPISPVSFSLFGLDIRWYALAYIISFIFGFWLMRQLAEKYKALGGVKDKKKFWDDIMAYGIVSVIVGGRLGYILFYNPVYFLSHPLEIFALWHGGMSFHGGLLGVIAAAVIFAKVKKVSFLKLMDIAAVAAPIGLFLGRIANFINMEVMGRITESRIGVIFDGTGQTAARHASPLYEAALEGIVLFAAMFIMYRIKWFRERAGFIGGSFLALYGIFRIFVEQFREPDAHIGFLTSWGLTMGQLLSALMLIVGAAAIAHSFRKKK
ncbi:MAG: prolipoprotein diacylglyceryl transferase [Rickettsiales bacterium]|jgi:phosphatidylglycerol:prolipoprotein diacylglycerol transferase|nr:prolipoprotein diacylglyceryl transferase [Rickettsiales bacterium]